MRSQRYALNHGQDTRIVTQSVILTVVRMTEALEARVHIFDIKNDSKASAELAFTTACYGGIWVHGKQAHKMEKRAM
jgi:hypothetical protein